VSPTTVCSRGALADRLADHDQSGRDADAHGEARPIAAGALGAERRQYLEDCEAATNRTFGVLLLRVRVSEIDQHAIAHELGDVAIEAPDRFRHSLLKGADHITHVFRIDLGREARRVCQIAEHYGQVPSLAACQVAISGGGGWRLNVPGRV
jgi:hypothetical protein